jgi:hypothetical protein
MDEHCASIFSVVTMGAVCSYETVPCHRTPQSRRVILGSVCWVLQWTCWTEFWGFVWNNMFRCRETRANCKPFVLPSLNDRGNGRNLVNKSGVTRRPELWWTCLCNTAPLCCPTCRATVCRPSSPIFLSFQNYTKQIL